MGQVEPTNTPTPMQAHAAAPASVRINGQSLISQDLNVTAYGAGAYSDVPRNVTDNHGLIRFQLRGDKFKALKPGKSGFLGHEKIGH